MNGTWRISILLATLSAIAISAPNFCAAQEAEESELITGKQFPDGYGVPPMTLSPDKRYGVLAPDLDHYDEGRTPQNKVVEMKTGRVLVLINAETGLVHMNHGGILPTDWSTDGSFLLWHVDGKWFPRACVLIKIDNGEVKWQRDLLKMMQQEILARTRKADPKKYAAAKKQNAGNGSAYPEGFTVSISEGGEDNAPLSLPLELNAQLESNPKAIEDYPKKADITSEMKGVIDADGKLLIKDFHLGILNPD